MTYLFDTNVCIAAMRGNAKVIQELAARSPEDCAVSMVSVFELFAGVLRCNDPAGEGQIFRVRLRISTIYLYRVSIPPVINLKSQIKSMTRMTFLENTFIEFLIVE